MVRTATNEDGNLKKIFSMSCPILISVLKLTSTKWDRIIVGVENKEFPWFEKLLFLMYNILATYDSGNVEPA